MEIMQKQINGNLILNFSNIINPILIFFYNLDMWNTLHWSVKKGAADTSRSPTGPTMEKWSKNGFGFFPGGPPEIVEKSSKNRRKIVRGRPRPFFDDFSTIFQPFFNEIQKPKGTAAEGRRPLWGAAGGRPLYFIEKMVEK